MKQAILQLLIMPLPWMIRRFFLKRILNIEFGDGSKIGFSIILARKIKLGKNTRIGHFNICKPIDELIVGDYSLIGTKNYITGFSVVDASVIKHKHFAHIVNRQCVLHIGKHTAITSRHYFDCNGGIYIGDFSEVAGFENAFMTHSIDAKENRQDAQPITIGSYTFIGARCMFLKGTSIPSFCIVGACSLVNKVFDKEYTLYGGVPAKELKDIQGYKFFERNTGFVE